MLLTNKHEEYKSSDYGKYDIPGDKIRVNDEPYEHMYTVFNEEDARLFKRVYNKTMKKYFGVTMPLVYRRHVQAAEVFYDIYQHRWCVRKNGRLVESYDLKLHESDKWSSFKREINDKLGKVYSI